MQADPVDVLEGRGGSPALTFHTLPNVMWHYSSAGYLVIQLLISELTGLEFPEAMAELVFGPLRMSSSTFETPLPNGLRSLALPGGQTVTLTATEPDQWNQRKTEITLPGQPRTELSWPFTDGHWTIPGIGALVVHEPPDDLVFHQNGRSVRAKRVT